ncbi:hypothetical protein Hamer_G020683, partial [Homarus americanus]
MTSAEVTSAEVPIEVTSTKGPREVTSTKGPQRKNSPQFPSTTIDLKEIRQVNRKDDPQGIKQNIRVVIQPNESIPAYTTWTLYSKNSTNFVVYNSITLVNETCPPGEETTIEFEGTFVPSNITILHVTNNLTRDDVAFYYAVVDIEDLGTRVAWVGTSDDEVSYLRVETGTLDNVPVKDKVVCNQEDSPCYYPRTDLMDDLQIPRCKDLTAGDKTIKHCDDVIGQSQEMADTPTLLLQQEVKALGVTYKSNASSVQVIVSKPEDKNILSQIDCVTEGEDPQSCKATLSDEDYKQDVINNMVVLLNSDGYVTEAAMVRFEVYKISTAKLTGDAALVVWRHGTEGTYIVSASTTKEETKVTINCPASTDGTCRGHVVNVDLSEVPMVSVEKNDTSNSVQSTKITDTTPQKNKVTKLTQIIDTEQTTKSAITMASHSEGITKVTVAKLILVNQGDSRTYRETYYEGKVKDDGEFRFEFDDDILDGEGTTTMDFLAIGYKEDGNKPDNKCNSTVSPCYFEDDASLTKLLSLCLSLKNNIPGDTVETVQQCMEQQPTNFKELVNPVHLNLNEQKTQNTMVVRTECTKEAKTLEVVAPGNDIKDCPLDPPTPCEVELNSHPPAFSVFVVCLQDDEVVLESKKETFQDLQVETKQLTKDLLEVRWITPNPESYKATVQATEALLINNNSPPLSRDAIPATEVSCNEKNMNCVAHFLVGTISSYTVTVQRKGDSSHIITKAGDMDSSFEPHTSIVTKVSKIDDGTTRVSLAAALQEDTSSVQLSVVKESDITVEATCKDGKMVPNSSSTYEFTHQDPVFIPGMLTKFFLVARGREDALQSVGQVYLMVEELNDNLDWVGAEKHNTSASLRISPFDAEYHLPDKNKICLKGNTTCYFLQEGGQSNLNLERCKTLDNTASEVPTKVDECDENVTPFKEFSSHVSVTVESGKVNVILITDDSNSSSLEVIAYDPNDPSTVYTTENNVPCIINKDSHVCTRTIKNSGYSKPVNVLVVSFDENGAVKESALLISYFPGAPPTTTPNWVIVVSVLGSVFGLAFIAFITIFVVKKKRAHKEVQREIQLAYEKESTSGRDNEAYPSPRDSPIFIMPRDAPRISSRASPSMRAREEPRTSYQPSSHQQAGDEEYHSPDHKFQKQRDSVAPQPGNGDSRFRPQGRLPVVRVRPTPPPKPSPSELNYKLDSYLTQRNFYILWHPPPFHAPCSLNSLRPFILVSLDATLMQLIYVLWKNGFLMHLKTRELILRQLLELRDVDPTMSIYTLLYTTTLMLSVSSQLPNDLFINQ